MLCVGSSNYHLFSHNDFFLFWGVNCSSCWNLNLPLQLWGAPTAAATFMPNKNLKACMKRKVTERIPWALYFFWCLNRQCEKYFYIIRFFFSKFITSQKLNSPFRKRIQRLFCTTSNCGQMHPVIFYGPWGVYLNLIRVHQWKIAGIGCIVYGNWLHTSGKRSSCEHPRITLYAPVIKLRRGVDQQKGLNPHLKLCGFPGVQWPQSLSNTRRLRSEASRSFTKMCNPAKRGDQEQDFRCPL